MLDVLLYGFLLLIQLIGGNQYETQMQVRLRMDNKEQIKVCIMPKLLKESRECSSIGEGGIRWYTTHSKQKKNKV